MATSEVRPDSQLIALGRELDLLVQRYEVARQRFIPVNSALEQWCRDNPGYDSKAYLKTYAQLSEGVGGEHPDNVMNEVDPVSKAIIAIPAITLAGLAVKARLAAFAADDLWTTNDEDADWDVLAMRKPVRRDNVTSHASE